MEKKWYTSKTQWFNLVGIVTAVVEMATGVIPGIDINGANGILVISVVNAALRWASNKKIIL